MPYCLTDGSLDRFFICWSTAFPTVCMLYCSAYGTTARLWDHSYLLLVDDFANVPRAVDCSPDRSFFRSSTAFTTVYAPYCSADGSALLILPLVNGFHNGLRAVLLSGWQWIAHSSARQRLSQRFARCIAQRMAAHCSFFRSSTAFTTVFAPYCSADGSGLLILPLVNGFHNGSRAVLLSGWQRIAHSSARQRLSPRFARYFAERMVAHCSFFRSSTAFTTVCARYCSADGSGLLILPLVNGFRDALRAILLSGW